MFAKTLHFSLKFHSRLHNNGRMLDIYWRLMGKEEDFFIPHDLELSNEELAFITRKSEQWRGEEGERRKVAVYDYIWEEEEVPLDNSALKLKRTLRSMLRYCL